MKTRLYCNEIDISERIKSLNKKVEFVDKNLIGNVASSEYTIVINNKDGYLDEEKLSKNFTVKVNDVLYDTIFVYESPQELFEDITLVLYDSCVKTSVPFLTDSSTYPKKIQYVIDEMSMLIGIDIDYSLVNVSVLDKIVNTYDNSIAIRSYLSWVAELSACNVISLPNGIIKFIPINKTYSKNIENDQYVYEFKTGAVYTCSRVMFDNGIKVIEKGKNEDNTIYLSDDNPYISDDEDDISISQAQIDLVYELVGGISFTSISGLKMRSIDNLMIGEIIHYKNFFDCMAISYEIEFYNGDLAHNTMIVDGCVDSTNKEKAVVVSSSESKKKLNVILDNQNQKLSIIAEEVNNIPIPQASAFAPENPKEGQVWIDITMDPPTEKIYSDGQWVVVGDYTGDLSGLSGQLESLNTSLTLEQGKIETLIKNNTTIINGNEVTLKEAYSYIQQEIDAIQFAISESGGNNKLLNSCGWNGLKYWDIEGDATSLSNTEIRNSTISGYAFQLNIGHMQQSFKTIVGRKYSVSCKIKKFTNSCTLIIKNGTSDDVLFNLNEEYRDGWISFSMPIEAEDTSCTIYIESNGEYLLISDLMVNDGEISQQWSSSNDEIYTLNVKIDREGVEVSQDGTNNRTVMNTTEFAGYDSNKRVFSVNGDVTTVNRLKAESDVQVGLVRMYALTENSKNGLGFAYVKGGSL